MLRSEFVDMVHYFLSNVIYLALQEWGRCFFHSIHFDDHIFGYSYHAHGILYRTVL